jgi:hypothetical protein
MLNCYNGINITFESKADGKKWLFDFVANTTIVEDTATLTDTCVIEIPKKISWQGAAANPLKRGDKVLVKIGYDGQMVERFAGYVKTVGTKVPVKIECEDGMFLLKLKAIEKETFKNCTLDTLIEFLLRGTGISYTLIDTGVVLGTYRVTQSTVAKELNELKRVYGLMAYFRNGQLYVGFSYPLNNVTTIKIRYAKNLIAENTEYRNAEDIRVKVTATSVGNDNEKKTVTIGDDDGELIEIKIAGLSESELKKFADNALANVKYNGLRGNVSTFGEPVIHKGDKVYVELEDGSKGTFIVKKVEVQSGTGGYKQLVELGPIVNKNE